MFVWVLFNPFHISHLTFHTVELTTGQRDITIFLQRWCSSIRVLKFLIEVIDQEQEFSRTNSSRVNQTNHLRVICNVS